MNPFPSPAKTTDDRTQSPHSPMWSPFLREGMDSDLDLSGVPEMTTVSPNGGYGDYGRVQNQDAKNGLLQLRLSFPHLPIIPFPAEVRTLLLLTNVAQDVDIPDTSKLAIFRGNGDYYVSQQGKADIPADKFSKSVYKPEGFLMYLGNVNQLSLIAPLDNTVVTLMLYTGL